MTNTKAQVGDLIRIVNAQTQKGHYKNGDILEVVGRWCIGVIIDVDSPYNDIYDTEYVIHRKAGEEDSRDNCGKQGVHTCRGAEYHASLHEGESVVPAQSDAVNSPQHYTQGRVEVIDVIEQFTSGYNDGFTAHCIGTATKYIARAPYKHATPLEDLRKAARYLAFAIEHEQRKTDASK